MCAALQELSYAELDAALSLDKEHRVPIPFIPRITMGAAGKVAWEQRRRNPGSAPVPGEEVRYVITMNGGVKVSEKADTPENVISKHIPVDRKYYLEKLRQAVENLFGVIFRQEESRHVNTKKETDIRVKQRLDAAFWRLLLNPLKTDGDTKRKRMEASPIAQMFAASAAKAQKK